MYSNLHIPNVVKRKLEELIKAVETKALPFISPESIVNANQAQSHS